MQNIYLYVLILIVAIASVILYVNIKNTGHWLLCNKLNNYVKTTKDDWNYILAPDLYNKLYVDRDPELFLLDVRKPTDYEKGHIPGSSNLFWLDLFDKNNISNLPKDKTIVIICYVGHTASQTLVLLKLLGYKAVVLKYGMGVSPVEDIPRKGWLDYNYPLEVV